jgi:hypothetical protein
MKSNLDDLLIYAVPLAIVILVLTVGYFVS